MRRTHLEVIRHVRATVQRELRLALASLASPPAEVEEADQAALAVRAIRESGIRVWFEPNLTRARTIQRQCQGCKVFVPTGHLRLVGDDEAGSGRDNELAGG